MSDPLPVVLSMFDNWNQREFSAVLELFDESVEFELTIGSPIDGKAHGLAETEGIVRDFWSRFGIFRTEITESIVNDERVAVHTHHFARGRQSEVEVEMTNWQVFAVENERIVRYLICSTKDQALQAAGLDAAG